MEEHSEDGISGQNKNDVAGWYQMGYEVV